MNWIAKYPFTEPPDLDAGGLVALVSPTTKVDGAAFALRCLGVEIRDAISYQTGAGPLVILMGRTPNDATYHEMVVRKGTGVYDIDSGRVDANGEKVWGSDKKTGFGDREKSSQGRKYFTGGRFPTNLILTEAVATLMDEQSGDLGHSFRTSRDHQSGMMGWQAGNGEGYDDGGGGASRFYHHIESLEEVVFYLDCLFVGPTRISI